MSGTVVGSSGGSHFWHVLIRTHHITSRKKVAALKAAAKKLNCKALLRSGGVPGLMYVQGHTEVELRNWIKTAHDLRYKDFQVVAPVESVPVTSSTILDGTGSLREIDSVREMGIILQQQGLVTWWKRALGFGPD